MPIQNPLGFGPSDFIELALTLLLIACILLRSCVMWPLEKLAARTGWCMLLFAVAPVALRVALLPNHPVPAPEIYDEFSHLLVADTLRHFRLANPPHALHQFFETLFVLQEPAYASIYPIGQGLVMTLGKAIFGLPWAGVLVASAAFCSLCYWMLRGWVSPGWAFLGGVLAIIEFGPLNMWTNSYWGGLLTATAGCLVFGALPRIQQTARIRDGALLGLGLALHLLTRPYESIFLFVSVALFFRPSLRLSKPALAAAAVIATAILLMIAQNRSVTGSWTTLPYQLSQYQYGVPAALTCLPNPMPHRELTPEQQLDYKMQLSFHGSGTETIGSYLRRLEYRIRYYRFYFLPPLYVALAAFLFALRHSRYVSVAGTVLLFALGTNFFPAFQFHYIAAITCLFILLSIVGLQQISRIPMGAQAAHVIIYLCLIHFAFWYGVHLVDNSSLAAYETWPGINHGQGQRIDIYRELAQNPGTQLVFVRYWPNHKFQDEWIYNAADIDHAQIVWARDLGSSENVKLLKNYPERKVWLLEPDATPPLLSPYIPEPSITANPPAPPQTVTTPPKPKPLQPSLRFEDVPKK